MRLFPNVSEDQMGDAIPTATMRMSGGQGGEGPRRFEPANPLSRYGSHHPIDIALGRFHIARGIRQAAVSEGPSLEEGLTGASELMGAGGAAHEETQFAARGRAQVMAPPTAQIGGE